MSENRILDTLSDMHYRVGILLAETRGLMIAAAARRDREASIRLARIEAYLNQSASELREMIEDENHALET